MTTKPKAKKFRIRRTTESGEAEASSTQSTSEARTTSVEATRPAVPQSTSAAGKPAPATSQASLSRRPAPGPQDARTSAAGSASERPSATSQESRPTAAHPATPRTAATSRASVQPATSRPPSQSSAVSGGGASAAPAAQEDAAMHAGEVSSPAQVQGETDMEAIRQEGLTGRQLRMARRVAQKHGLAPTSDFDAVRLLRKQGIDPFQRSNMLELVNPAGHSPEKHAAEGKVQLPQTVQVEKQKLPSTESMPPSERRAIEIARIQKELAARRRKKMMLLLARLAVFVLLPTFIMGYYFYVVATPMYSTKSEFLILKNDGSGAAVPSFLSGTSFDTAQDAIATQSYLQSKEVMLRLDADVGFVDHFSQESIDPIQRLEPDASNEEAYKLYKKNVQISFDPTEGVIRMEITAADPDLAAQFSRALITYAEARVDNLTARKRSDSVLSAESNLIKAENDRMSAQEKLVRMQQEGNIVDPEGRIGALRAQINTRELELQEKRLQLQALLDNSRPNTAKVDGTRGDIRRLEALLAQLNNEMTQATTGEQSLAEMAVQIKLAEADLATRDLMLQSALERLEGARREADNQARYMTTSVEPVASEDPSYPRKFENTILAFLIFAGAYLMISLTASILREQVSS
ncbi:capsule biosynthesis protein [Sagittula marina]